MADAKTVAASDAKTVAAFSLVLGLPKLFRDAFPIASNHTVCPRMILWSCRVTS